MPGLTWDHTEDIALSLAEKFPDVVYRLDHYEMTKAAGEGAMAAKTSGELTISGQTKPVTIDVEFRLGPDGAVRQELMARFDLNHDGRLDEQELPAMQKFLQERRAQGASALAAKKLEQIAAEMRQRREARAQQGEGGSTSQPLLQHADRA